MLSYNEINTQLKTSHTSYTDNIDKQTYISIFKEKKYLKCMRTSEFCLYNDNNLQNTPKLL